jgi:alpha-glucosidase
MNKILGSAWEFDPLTEQYYYHAFFKQQPDLNWRNPEVKEAMFDAATFWLEKGVDGFRLDLVNHLVEDEQLRENPLRCPLLSFQDLQEILPYEWQGHLYDRDQEETHTILKELRSLTDRYPGRMMVGEAMTFDPEVAVTYYGSGEDELHLVFNFRFITCSFNATKFFAAIEEWEKLLPSGAWPCLTLSNHDQARHIGRFGGSFGVHGLSPDAEARARVAAALLLTLRGTPFLYYGEEIGMPNCVVWPWEVKDPTGKIFWPAFQGRDLCRTPMQWEPSPQAGFTTGIPWLKVDKSYRCHNVAFQEEDACSLLNFYKKLIKLRREIPALSHGLIRLIPEAPSGSLSYLRSHSGEDVLVILNFRREGLPLKDLGDSPSLDQDKRWTVTFSSCRQEGVKLELNRAWLLPYEVLILS